jgi:hypothetical protein
MTLRNNELKKCVCRYKAEIVEMGRHEYSIRCVSPGCWVGPVRKTRHGAIRAWNKLMERGHWKTPA